MRTIIAVKIVNVGRVLTVNAAHQKMQLASIRVDGLKTRKRKASVQVSTAKLKARPFVWVQGLLLVISVAS